MLNSKISIFGIIDGLNRALNVANNVIPLYEKAKPMLSNAKNVLTIVKEFNKSDDTTIKNDKEEQVINITHYNNPVFFQ